jgi:hypothetical protein
VARFLVCYSMIGVLTERLRRAVYIGLFESGAHEIGRRLAKSRTRGAPCVRLPNMAEVHAGVSHLPSVKTSMKPRCVGQGGWAIMGADSLPGPLGGFLRLSSILF